MDQSPAIIVENVSKSFKLPHEKQSSVKSLVINAAKRKKGYEVQKVLKDVSLEIKQGEFFGIVGRNGSGKSTLLKLLAGIYIPDQGRIKVNGNLIPFIELGVGFNPELTGRENVFLNGSLLGFSRKEMKKMYNEIVEFAEIERFMDQKLKNYSSGMQVRLAFSIAIRAQSDILLIDEVLAVGDERFQNKCLKTFSRLKKDGRTIVFVSHDMEAVKKFCDKAILLHEGKLVAEGPPGAIADQYIKLNFPEAAINNTGDTNGVKVVVKREGKKLQDNTLLKGDDNIAVEVQWKDNPRIKNVGVALFSEDGNYIFGTNTMGHDKSLKGNHIGYNLNLNLGKGKYLLQVGLFGETDSDKVFFINPAFKFIVSSDTKWQGVTHMKHEWKW